MMNILMIMPCYNEIRILNRTKIQLTQLLLNTCVKLIKKRKTYKAVNIDFSYIICSAARKFVITNRFVQLGCQKRCLIMIIINQICNNKLIFLL
jgi:hypothetical protein